MVNLADHAPETGEPSCKGRCASPAPHRIIKIKENLNKLRLVACTKEFSLIHELARISQA
eukprot:1147765-Pelagomonas_calceolata.AAC.3